MSTQGNAPNAVAGGPPSADAPGQPLRPVDLGDFAPGGLLLSAMPGRSGDFPADLAQMTAHSVSSILCLVERNELERMAPDYARFCADAPVSPALISHPVPDLGLPRDVPAYRATINAASQRLKAGESLLIHCAAGIGRTGMTAIAVLCALGMDEHTARARVAAAGSGPETDEQREFLQELVRGC